MIIFTTIHGSHLYCLNNDQSDMDYYAVSDKRNSKTVQKIRNEIDYTVVTFNVFQKRLMNGSPQALEALFSRYKQYHPSNMAWLPYFESMRIFGAKVIDTYMRTLKNFCFGDFKKRRHAVRLAINIVELLQTGRFDPTLNASQIVYANEIASSHKDQELYKTLKVDFFL